MTQNQKKCSRILSENMLELVNLYISTIIEGRSHYKVGERILRLVDSPGISVSVGIKVLPLRGCVNPPREHGNERNGTSLLVVIRSVPI